MGHAAWIIKADWVIWKVKMFLLRGQWEGLSWKWKHLRLNWKAEMLLAFHFSSATWGSWWSRWPTLSPQEWSLAGQASWIWSSLQQKSVRWVKHTHAHTHAWTHYIYLEPEVGFETLKRWICLECVYIFFNLWSGASSTAVSRRMQKTRPHCFELPVLLFTGAKSAELRQTSQGSWG